MTKDRDQQTPLEPEDAERIERRREQGTGSSGEDVLAGERSAPGGAPTAEDPRAVDEVEAAEKDKYR